MWHNMKLGNILPTAKSERINVAVHKDDRKTIYKLVKQFGLTQHNSTDNGGMRNNDYTTIDKSVG